MVTVIDMITGEITHSSSVATESVQTTDSREWNCPSLALQEVVSEPNEVRMPPELAHIAIDDFLGE